MPRIFIHAETPGSLVRAEVVTLSEVDGIYAIICTGDGIDECPGDLEPGDTWSDFEDCLQFAIKHIGNHEARL
jgi:hypothetical protein